MASSKIKMTYGYEDGSTREVSLEPFALTAAALTNAKTNIKALLLLAWNRQTITACPLITQKVNLNS